MVSSVEELAEIVRIPSPAPAPQALAFDGASLWVGSWETNRVHCIDAHQGNVLEEALAPGKPVGATVVGDEIFFVVAEEGDARFIRRFVPGHGFKTKSGWPCPDDSGSFLAFDGTGLWLTQRHNKRALALDANANVVRTIDIAEEIIGAAFVDERLYLSLWLGAERGGCFIAYLEPKAETPKLTSVARSPFAATSLARDGDRLWTNDFSGNEIVAFAIPK
jgi:outer membrane protein assembly factor BamB